MENYDKNRQSSYIMYLDANNLYGWAMSRPLPYGSFKWVGEEIRPKAIKDWLLNINTKNKGIGRIYEVDLVYPDELHNLLSDYCKKIKNDYKISSGNAQKLIPTLHDKEKYVLHEENLKPYLKLNLKLKKCIEYFNRPISIY